MLTDSKTHLNEPQQQKRSDKIEDYKIVKFLGKGSYSGVYLGQNIQNNKFTAIKTIDKTFLEKQHKQHHVFIERDVLQQLHHPSIIQLTSAFQTSQKLYFCLEYASRGDLANFIKMNYPLSFEQIQFCTAQILVSLEYIHQNGIVHRDLKPENLLLTSDYHLKLTDFATAMIFDESRLNKERAARIKQVREKYSQSNKSTEKSTDESSDSTESQIIPDLCRTSSFVGTGEYLCPELIDQNLSGPASDLWALGCILYKMISGQTPFQDDLEYEMLQRITTEQIKVIKEAPNQATDLLNILLNKNYLQRFGPKFDKNDYNYDGLKGHLFFDGVDFKDMWFSHSPLNMKIQVVDQSPQLAQISQQMTATSDSNVSSNYFLLTGQVEKEKKFLVFTRHSLRIMTLYVYFNVPTLSYVNPQKENKKIVIQLNSASKCRLLVPGKFVIEDKNRKKYTFKEIDQPAQLWVDELNKIINDF